MDRSHFNQNIRLHIATNAIHCIWRFYQNGFDQDNFHLRAGVGCARGSAGAIRRLSFIANGLRRVFAGWLLDVDREGGNGWLLAGLSLWQERHGSSGYVSHARWPRAFLAGSSPSLREPAMRESGSSQAANRGAASGSYSAGCNALLQDQDSLQKRTRTHPGEFRNVWQKWAAALQDLCARVGESQERSSSRGARAEGSADSLQAWSRVHGREHLHLQGNSFLSDMSQYSINRLVWGASQG